MPDDDPLPLSALQHYLFCPRQCALIHVERLWAENVATVEGRLLHERSDKPGAERRRGVRVVQAMPLRSLLLGVAGVADLVELRRDGAGWRAFPVEYKRGRPKDHRADEVQLCAQAICLEEMLGRPVPEGALFYGAQRRRQPVAFDAELRALTARVAKEARAMLAAGRTPPPVYDPKRCDSCSLIELCRPRRLARVGPVARWLAARIDEARPP
jgi:CRISPR-associated exonuclease Cas4